MLKRLVKLTFQPDKTSDFIKIFEETQFFIRNTEGCLHLELLRDVNKTNIFFTLSHWENEAALEAYRQSDLFTTTWARTKILFCDRPEAWTTEVIGKN